MNRRLRDNRKPLDVPRINLDSMAVRTRVMPGQILILVENNHESVPHKQR